jgi:hypothetical protein
MRIELEIEELVLRGFEARDRDRIVAAIERDLASRVTAEAVMPLLRRDAAGSAVRAAQGSPALRVTQASSDVIGALVGGSIMNALAGPGGS